MTRDEAPTGSRILWRERFAWQQHREGVVDEWSPSGLRVKLNGFWHDAEYLTVIEVLGEGSHWQPA